MALVNEHFLKLPGSYLFSDIAKKVNTFRITHPSKRSSVWVSETLPGHCHRSAYQRDAQGSGGWLTHGHFRIWSRAGIKLPDSHPSPTITFPRGIHFGPTEIFVNDGAKSDTGNIGDILIRQQRGSDRFIRSI